jgi:hypothetical protein
MAIKKGKRTLEYERQYEEFKERQEKENHKVTCLVHGILFVRKDLVPMCPVCFSKKDEDND